MSESIPTLSSSIIPKLSFHSCNETSIKLRLKSSQLKQILTSNPQRYSCFIEYKETYSSWNESKLENVHINTKLSSSTSSSLESTNTNKKKKSSSSSISTSSSLADESEIILSENSLYDLKPGSPYTFRIKIIDNIIKESSPNNESLYIFYGPEVNFDTKPIDCMPKKKSCIIC